MSKEIAYTPASNKGHILKVATRMALKNGFNSLTRDSVAAEAFVAMGSVNHHYGTMDGLRDEVMRNAVENEILEIVAQGVASGHPIAQSAPVELKQRALTTLL